MYTHGLITEKEDFFRVFIPLHVPNQRVFGLHLFFIFDSGVH